MLEPVDLATVPLVRSVEGRIAASNFFEHAALVFRALDGKHLGPGSGEKLIVFHLFDVPGRVSKHEVKAAGPPCERALLSRTSRCVEDVREGDVPMEETIVVREPGDLSTRACC